MLIVFLIIAFMGALAIRLYDLTDLPLDFHATRQLQSMLKARGMYESSAPNIVEWQRELAVKQWKTMPTEEPEIVEHLAAFTYKVIGEENLWFPRFYSILFWIVGGVGLYLLLKHLVNTDGAVIGLLFYLFVPYGITASRAFMPDPLMLALIIWGLWALMHWKEKPGWGRAVLAGLLCGAAVYVKLTAVFYIAGGILGVALGEFGFKKAISQLQFWVIGILAILPGLTYNWLGIYVFKFIGQDAVQNRILTGMLKDPVSYLNWNNLIGVVVGFAAFLLSLAGIFLLRIRKARSLVIGLWAGYLIFGFFFIYYYTTHDYYHLPIIVLVSIGLAAIGETVIAKMSEFIRPKWFANFLLLAVLLVGMGEVCWQVRNDLKRTDYRPQAAFWAALGEKLRGTTSLAMSEDYNGQLSYWGWYDASYMPEIAELTHLELSGHESGVAETFKIASQGKEFFLVTMLDDLEKEPEFKAYLYQTYPIYDQGKGYVIFDLRQGQ